MDITNVAIRPVMDKELIDIYTLTRNLYIQEKYINEDQSEELFSHYAEYDNLKSTTIFVAIDNDIVVGSVSLCLNNDFGVPYDNMFDAEMQQAKLESQQTGEKFGVIYRIVTDNVLRNTYHIIFALIYHAVLLSKQQQWGFGYIVVNPRHVTFYKKAIGAYPITAKEECNSIKAPGVLLRIDKSNVYENWRNMCQKRGVDF